MKSKSKLPQWKQNQMSTYMEDGFGPYKPSLDEIKIRKQSHIYVGRLICPNCGENKSHNIIDIHSGGYFECRTCGYESDIDNWDRK